MSSHKFSHIFQFLIIFCFFLEHIYVHIFYTLGHKHSSPNYETSRLQQVKNI